MKKVFYLVLVFVLLLNLVGCKRNTKEQSYQVEDTLVSFSFLDIIKEKYEVEYTGNDIEYNIANMKDKEFVIMGTVKLSDYYNYGYNDKEEKMFCVKVKPSFETSKEDWYVYLDRDYWKDFYQDLVARGSIESTVLICAIPSVYYQEGQGQLAYGLGVAWD